MESEFYWVPELDAVQVNVTDLYDGELRKVLEEVGEEFEWSHVEYQTTTDGSEISEWAWLHGAKVKAGVR